MNDDYSKRELDQHFKDLGDKIDFNTKLTEDLNKKVGIQNGRVGKLETKWNSVVIGGIVGVALIGTIIGLVVYSFQLSQENLKQSILLQINH